MLQADSKATLKKTFSTTMISGFWDGLRYFMFSKLHHFFIFISLCISSSNISSSNINIFIRMNMSHARNYASICKFFEWKFFQQKMWTVFCGKSLYNCLEHECPLMKGYFMCSLNFQMQNILIDWPSSLLSSVYKSCWSRIHEYP